MTFNKQRNRPIYLAIHNHIQIGYIEKVDNSYYARIGNPDDNLLVITLGSYSSMQDAKNKLLSYKNLTQ